MEKDSYYVERCLDGHPDDFRHLVRRYQPVLLAHLAGKLGSRDRAEEAAQEALVRAYFNMSKLKKPQKFLSWLLGIGERVAKEQHRKESVRRQRKLIRASSAEALRPELRLIRFLRTFELKEVDMPTYPKVFQGLKDRSQACPRAYCIMGLGFAATAM